jgi:methylmalonyl-CoA mutase
VAAGEPTIAPLYGPGDAPARNAPLLRASPGAGWDVRVPVRSNAEALEALEGGAASLLLHARDIESVLAGVVLEAAPAALDAGFDGPAAARRLAEAARGSPAARLAFHMDPLSAFALAGLSAGPVAAHVALAARTAAELLPAHPEASFLLASGRVAHEAGGSAPQELGVMAAAGLAYARALEAAGTPLQTAFGAIALGLAVDGEILVSIAKLRAAREIWARIAAACGVAVRARVEARGSRRMLTALDPWSNLLRLTAAGFAGAAGGADALVLPAFTDALGPPGERARRLSRNIQLILQDECGLGAVDDPAAGAWAIEALTDRLAREGWAEMQAIEAGGGLARALISGSLGRRIEAARRAREAAVADGSAPIVGVSLYPDPEPGAVEVDEVPEWAPGPGPRLEGDDDGCVPLLPMRLAEAAELVSQDLEP